MKVRRKSLWRSQNNKLALKRRNQRAAKERKRLARVAREEPAPDLSHVPLPPLAKTGFRVTITCLDDGQRVSFTAWRGPFGLTLSPTRAGRKVAAVLAHYVPACPLSS
jgi:hypothetical protein